MYKINVFLIKLKKISEEVYTSIYNISCHYNSIYTISTISEFCKILDKKNPINLLIKMYRIKHYTKNSENYSFLTESDIFSLKNNEEMRQFYYNFYYSLNSYLN